MPPTQPDHGPTPGLPPRIEREQPTAALPPRIERGAEALPPRIEREPAPPPEPERRPEPGLPPRIEREPDPPAPAAEREEPAVAVTEAPQPAYQPEHARDAEPEPGPEPDPQPQPQPPPDAASEAAAGPQPVPIAPVRPDPLASPVRNVLRSHQRLAYVVLAVILVAAAGYWGLRLHQRIGEGSLEAGVTAQQHAPTVKCASLQSNGSVWACAVVYQAESVCLIANVNVLGSWSTKVGQHRCERVPELAALVPQAVTASMVAADINRRQRQTDFVCNKLPSHKVRWACERPLATGGQCLVVRVIQWTPWNVLDGAKTCAHDPDLQKALRRASHA